MIRQIIQRGLIAGMLVMSLTPLVYAGRHACVARDRAHHCGDRSQDHTATLRAQDAGQEFQMTA